MQTRLRQSVDLKVEGDSSMAGPRAKITAVNTVNPFRTMWKKFANAPAPARSNRFVDLAPTASADETGVYFEALDSATNNYEVLNIALTGPYGSGKSSVVKSFLSRYPRPALQLSLASFLPDGEVPGVKVSKQEIERSILQQMLYGADADRLPLSRFKRIESPRRWSSINSLFISIALLSTWYLLNKQAEIFSGSFFKPFDATNWLNLLCVLVVAVFVWSVVHGIYVKSFGLSLKSISLKDIEIAPHAADEESILNRHLDEIVYFFQSTEYDLVVIEDLDRFDNPDIFVTLREINGLLNANAGIHRRIRFLYALRDDIFVNTDRTKFFEFIVPVIPVINHSNSIDKVLEHGKRINLDPRIDPRFIRDVSRYLSDMRLIANIFNEYVIYSSNLKADQDSVLDPNKLLAVLVYKNVIPKDFAALHRQEGALSNVLRRYDEYVSKIETDIRSKLDSNRRERELSETQALKDDAEVRSVYAMALIARGPEGSSAVVFKNAHVHFRQLSQHPELGNMLGASHILFTFANGGQNRVEIKGMEASVDAAKTFVDRLADVARKSADYVEGLEKASRELKVQLASLRTRKFNEVIRENSDTIEEIFSEVGESRDLLKFLILEGYLDDTYYQYISLFHSGRLSPSDNKFLIQIRSYSNPHPDFQIDNASEVVASMRDEDFRQSYVLNRFVVDYLLSDHQKNSTRIAACIEFMAAHFDDSAEFFVSYYERGHHVDRLIAAMSELWPEFHAVALDRSESAAHAARILAYTPTRLFESTSFAGRRPLSRHFSQNAIDIIREGVEFDLGRLKTLSVELADIQTIAEYKEIAIYVAAEGLYQITVGNIGHIVTSVIGRSVADDLKKRHYSTLLQIDDDALLGRIRAGFETYVHDVLLKLEENDNEDLAAVIDVLNHSEVPPALRQAFLARQKAVFPDFAAVPSEFHHFLLDSRKIAPTWENCMTFISSDVFNAETLTGYLQNTATKSSLARVPLPGDDRANELRKFLINNDTFADDVYTDYVRMLPRQFQEFPGVGASKVKVLIKEEKVAFSTKNVESLDDTGHRVLFIAKNFAAHFADPDRYVIDDPFRAELLQADLSDADKLKIIAEIDPGFVSSNPTAASSIGPILDRAMIDKRAYGPEFVRSVIVNSGSLQVQLSLLNKLNDVLSPDDIREVVRPLPEPYCDIADYGKFPRIDNTEGNRTLSSWLKDRDIISSFTIGILGDVIRINTFRKGS